MEVTIECDHCHALYSISEPLQVGGVAHVGTQVSTEIGCPKCQEPNGTIAAREKQ